MNKRILSGISLLLAAGAVAVPYGIGGIVEREFIAQQQQLQEIYRLSPEISVTLENYRRGWFSSSADTVLTLDLRALGLREAMNAAGAFSGLPDTFRFVTHNDIRHGPLLLSPEPRLVAARVESKLEAPESLRKLVPGIAGNEPLMSAVTHVSLAGSAETNLMTPAWRGSPIEGLVVDWRGFHGTAHGAWFSIDGEFSGEAPLLEVRAGDHRFAIESIKMRSENRLGEYGPTGTMHVDVSRIEAMVATPGAAPQSHAIEDVSMATVVEVEDGLLAASQDVHVAQARFGESALGPAELRVSISNLDMPAYAALIDELNRLAREHSAGHAPGADAVERMQESVLQLLKRSPAFEISMSRLVLPQGEVAGKLRFAYIDAGGFSLEEPAELLMALRVEGELSIPAVVSTQIACNVVSQQLEVAARAQGVEPPAVETAQLEDIARDMLAELEGAGTLVRENDRHLLRFQLEGGQGSLNGMPLFTIEDILAAAAARGM